MKRTFAAKSKSLRGDVLRYAAKQYGTQPESLWLSLPGYAVLRHEDNRKWYGLFMDVPRKKLGLSGEGSMDVLEVKCDPILAGSLRMEPGVLPAYHMHRENWITVLLDGTVKRKRILFLLDQSFFLTASRQERTMRRGPKCWLVPANPKYFDLEQAFRERDTIFWKQSSRVSVGDTVFLYVAAPVSAIRYQCRAVEVDLPPSGRRGPVSVEHRMRLQLQHRFQEGELSLAALKEYGVTTVRGPRYVPEELLRAIRNLWHES